MTTLAAAVRWNETLASLWADERKAAAAFLLALAEFDEKRVWEVLGYSGLFRYLTGALGMSEALAYYRKEAARLVRWCPAALEALRERKLCLTSLAEVSKVLTPENWEEVLPKFFGKSKREAQAVVAALVPAATPQRDVIVPLAPALHPGEVTRSAALPSRKTTPSESPPRWESGVASSADSSAAVSEVEVQAEGVQGTVLHRIHFTASEVFVKKLQKAKDAVAHRIDASHLEAVLDAALEALLEKEAKRPKASIAQAAKRQVQERDEGQCQWPLLQGGVCGEKRFLQLDHVIPKARGGDGGTGNLRLLCARHNREAAKRAFGEAWVGRFGTE